MTLLPYNKFSLVDKIRQSPPVDLDIPFDPTWLRGKVILITGGASGFGAGFVTKWAAAGACVIIGDINTDGGDQLARETRKETGNDQVHFVHCNVCDWQSQVNFFKEAIRLSPHGGIDIVVPNAGIAGADDYEDPKGLDAPEPPKPNLMTFEVNLVGVLYTVHLGLFHLQRNPGSNLSSAKSNPKTMTRDRCIILMGSMASLSPIPAQVLYGVSKHGVLGIYRSLRATAWVHGIRVNLLCPYFIDTPIVPASARVMLAGGGMGKPEDVIDAATRLAADTRIVGRSLYIGPKMQIVEDEQGVSQLVAKPTKDSKQRAIWEAYAEDYDDSEAFGRNVTRLLNQFMLARGWFGWAVDIVKAVQYGVGIRR